MPDGGIDEDFPHVVRTVDSLVAIGAIPPMIVVGVPNTERRRDLTGPTRVSSDSTIAPHVGRSGAFRQFFRQELIPTIDARYATTRERAIIGESLAGLFVVETLLREPLLFDRYVAFDPSLWWNGGALVDSASTLLSWFTPAHRREAIVRRQLARRHQGRDDTPGGRAHLIGAKGVVVALRATAGAHTRDDLRRARGAWTRCGLERLQIRTASTCPDQGWVFHICRAILQRPPRSRINTTRSVDREVCVVVLPFVE